MLKKLSYRKSHLRIVKNCNTSSPSEILVWMRIMLRIMKMINSKYNSNTSVPSSLQSLLSHDEHEEINQISGQPVEEHRSQELLHFIRGYSSIRVPDSCLERIFVGDLLSHQDHFAPGHLLLVRTGQVVNRHVFTLLLLLRLHVWNGDQSIDGKVHGDYLEIT